MPRPKKCRLVCGLPRIKEFCPDKLQNDEGVIIMTIDEFEVIRLIDYENLSQEQCGERMQVARTTAQLIYDSARKKIADCLVDGKRLVIQGGDYVVCPHLKTGCKNGCPKCKKNLMENDKNESGSNL